jgi:hypothetical protein
MKPFLKMFLALFSVFMVILVLTTIDQTNTIPGQWATITGNFIGFIPYSMLIVYALYHVFRRK